MKLTHPKTNIIRVLQSKKADVRPLVGRHELSGTKVAVVTVPKKERANLFIQHECYKVTCYVTPNIYSCQWPTPLFLRSVSAITGGRIQVSIGDFICRWLWVEVVLPSR